MHSVDIRGTQVVLADTAVAHLVVELLLHNQAVADNRVVADNWVVANNRVVADVPRAVEDSCSVAVLMVVDHPSWMFLNVLYLCFSCLYITEITKTFTLAYLVTFQCLL